MPHLSALLTASLFDGLAITKTPAGFAASILTIDGWSPDIVKATAADAVIAALLPVVEAQRKAWDEFAESHS